MKLLNKTKLLTTVQTLKYKMKFYCLNCRKDIENKNPKVSSTSNGKAMIILKCPICGNEKSRSIKNQEAKGLLSN